MAVYPSSTHGVPYIPPAPRVNLWPGASMTWTGWDGSVWDLTGPRNGSGVALMEGVRGLDMPEVTHRESESEAREGTRWLSSHTNKREVYWPLTVFNDKSSAEWVAYNRAFRRTMHPKKPGLWAVRAPDNSVRSLICRFASDGGQGATHSPGLFGWMNFGYTLQAEQPYWTGTPVSRSWIAGTDDLPFMGTYGGPPFYISPAATLDTATIPNEGDEPAFVTWTLDGPIDAGVLLGVGDALMGYPDALGVGDRLVINTRDVSARLNGTRVSQKLDPRAPLPVEPDAEAPLSIAAAGGGKITATLTPLYFTAT